MLAKGEPNPENYAIREDVEFFVDILEKIGNYEVPFRRDDLQLEFIMLDPYYRVPLRRLNRTETFRAEFKVPDKLGVFKFKIEYKRHGYTFVEQETLVSLRQWKHNEFPRFQVQAYPYYASTFLMLAAFFLFTLMFLYSKPAK